MNLEKQETKEYEKGLSDLAKFVHDNDPEIKKDSRIAKILLYIGILGFLLSLNDLRSDEASFFMMTLTIMIGLVGFYGNYRDSKNTSDFQKFFSPKLPGREFYIETSKKISISGTEIPFSKLFPSRDEEAIGFVNLFSPNICTETAFVSSLLDNELILATYIPIDTDSRKKNFTSRSPEIKRKQLVYLVTRVYSKQHRTFNDEKICFEASITELRDVIRGEHRTKLSRFGFWDKLVMNLSHERYCRAKVKLSKVGYFDGLITNEAFRSRIYEKPKIADSTDSELFADLTREFPVYKDLQGNYFLHSQPASGVSRHIGITTIAITSDNHIVYFKQAITSMIGARLLVASGSGSADFADIRSCENPSDLTAVIKYAMARELCEEGGVLEEYTRHSLKQSIKDVANRTLLTGFFRWVDRSGKPEFIGITKLEQALNEIPGDNFEVYISNVDQFRLRKWRIEKLSDFEIFKNEFIQCNLKLSLSFYIALERLITIARYEHSRDPIEKSIFTKVSHFIFS